MTTPNTNVTFTSIQTEFGGANPISLNEYYSGGGYVSAGLTSVPTSGTISVNDLRNKAQPYYGTLTPSIYSADEGSVVNITFTLSGTSGIPDGSTLYWKVFGTNITSGDFATAMTGSFTITSGTGSFIITPQGDAIIEGTETFYVSIGIASGVPVAYVTSPGVNLTETMTYSSSISSSTHSYPYNTWVNEGGTISMTLSTYNVPGGTTLYYVVVPSSGTVNSSDFNGSAMSGALSAVTITSGANGTVAPLNLVISADSFTEGIESFYISVRSGSTSGTEVYYSATITIWDTSTTPTPYITGAGMTGWTTSSFDPIDLQITIYGNSLGGVSYSRTFEVWGRYDLTNDGVVNYGSWYDTGGRVTIPPYSAGSAATTVYSAPGGGTTYAWNYQVNLRLAGYVDYDLGNYSGWL